MTLIAAALIFCLAFMTGLWAWGRRIHNAGIVDVAWSSLIALVTLFYAFGAGGWPPRKWLLAAMVGLWGTRLALHVFVRILRSKAEDPRYEKLREKWGEAADGKMLRFYYFQGLVAVFFSVPFLMICANPAEGLSGWEWAGAALWLIALSGETAADAQLEAFKADKHNRGKTCRAGLWRYSRHPNYFFEWLNWCAYFLFALATPWGWIAVYQPAMIFYFLFKVTGIPMAEEQALKSRGEQYRQYQKTTSVFVPWFPKRSAHVV